MKKWWQRARRAPPADVSDGAENLLVISDIHLGEDILVDGPPQLSEYIRALNLALTEFITAYSAGAMPWHLVINGDMFDFVKVAGSGDDAADAAPLSNTPENVVRKLHHILEVHRPLFRALALFLRAGHRVTIIEGNHDAEFYFDDVRHALRDELVRLALQNLDKGADPAQVEAGVRARLGFRSWFLASLGRYHIEHGHQYDEFCSFEYPLAPYDAGRGRTLATPMSHRPLPYFSELLGDFSTHGIGRWSFGDLLAFFRRLGPRAFVTLLRLYVSVGFGLLRLAGGKRRAELSGLAAQHDVQLLALSQSSPYGLATLKALDQLKAPPAEYAVWKMAHVFYLDRIALCAVGLLAALGCALTGHVLATVLELLGTGAGIGILSYFGKHDARPLLRTAAAQIAGLTGAPYVVFGHSHAPEVSDLATLGDLPASARAHYLNSGSWVTREVLLGDAGQGMTYVEISADGAKLLRWRGPDKAPDVVALPEVPQMSK